MKLILKIIGWILFFPLTFIIVDSLISDMDAADILIGAIWVCTPIVAFVRWAVKSHNKEEKEMKAFLENVIPENVGEHSYIDDETDTIYLRSWDYDKRSGAEWVITNNGIKVSENRDWSSETFPIRRVRSVVFEDYFLSFKIRGKDSGDIDEYTLFFEDGGLEVAKTAHERILNGGNESKKQQSEPKSRQKNQSKKVRCSACKAVVNSEHLFCQYCRSPLE